MMQRVRYSMCYPKDFKFIQISNTRAMKTIVFSFDDARSDFYSRAFPIMKQYGIPSTLNVITRYMSEIPNHVDRKDKHYTGGSTYELLECYQSGLVEIACHGANHQNTREDILQNIADFHDIGINEPIFGFASPGCGITEQNKNENGIWNLVEEGQLLYVRSGISIRREGYIYMALSYIDRYIHSKRLFRYLNLRNIIRDNDCLREHVLPSTTIFSYTRLEQIKYFIENMPDSSIAVLMFHSILQKGDEGYGYDRYYWDADTFESFCVWLKSHRDIRICKTKELL